MSRNTVRGYVKKSWTARSAQAQWKFSSAHSSTWTALLMAAFATPVFLNSHTNYVFLHSRKRPASITDNFFAFRTTVLYLQSPLGSFWSLLTKTVWHFVASQKYSINVHLPTSGRAVVPSAYRMAKRKPIGIIAIERANDIHSTKQQIDKWINHSMNVQIECNLAFLSWLS